MDKRASLEMRCPDFRDREFESPPLRILVLGCMINGRKGEYEECCSDSR